MKKINMDCYDYTLELFKGFGEINNYQHLKLEERDSNLKKIYYINQNENKFIMEKATSKNEFEIAELINIGVKYLDTLKIDDIKLKISYDKSNEELAKEVIETIYSIDLECNLEEVLVEEGQGITYSLGANEIENIIIGSAHLLEIDYKKLENTLEKLELIPKKDDVELYVISKEEEVKSDAFIIGTLLKNSGFKTEIDYTNRAFEDKLKNAKEINVSYVIIVDKESIKNYSVKLFDVAFKKEKTVNIDNLFQELYMGDYEENLK